MIHAFFCYQDANHVVTAKIHDASHVVSTKIQTMSSENEAPRFKPSHVVSTKIQTKMQAMSSPYVCSTSHLKSNRIAILLHCLVQSSIWFGSFLASLQKMLCLLHPVFTLVAPTEARVYFESLHRHVQ